MKTYNRQLIRRKFIKSSTNLPTFKKGGNMFQRFGKWSANTTLKGLDMVAGTNYYAGDDGSGSATISPDTTLAPVDPTLAPTGPAAVDPMELFLQEQRKTQQAQADAALKAEQAATKAAAEEAANQAKIAAEQVKAAAESSRLQKVGNVQSQLTPPTTTAATEANELKSIVYRKGGLVKPMRYQQGGMIQPNAELEQGEPFMTPDGDMNAVSPNAPTHEEGGVPLNLPNNTKIIGEQDNGNKLLKEQGRKLVKLQKKYKDTLENRPTQVDRRTANMMLQRNQEIFNSMFMQQELQKQYNTI